MVAPFVIVLKQPLYSDNRGIRGALRQRIRSFVIGRRSCLPVIELDVFYKVVCLIEGELITQERFKAQALRQFQLAIRAASQVISLVFVARAFVQPGYRVPVVKITVISIAVLIRNGPADPVHLPKISIKLTGIWVRWFLGVLEVVGEIPVHRDDGTQFIGHLIPDGVPGQIGALHNPVLLKVAQGKEILYFFVSAADIKKNGFAVILILYKTNAASPCSDSCRGPIHS